MCCCCTTCRRPEHCDNEPWPDARLQ
jgi:hypothetical protein